MAHNSGSKLAKPPKKENAVADGIALIFIAVVVFNVAAIATVVLLGIISGSEWGSLSIWIPGIIVGAIAAIAFGVIMRSRTQSQSGKVEAAYKAAMLKWEHSWLCLKCGNSFYVR